MEMDYETVVNRLLVNEKLTQDEITAITRCCARLVLDGDCDGTLNIFAKAQRYHLFSLQLHRAFGKLMVGVALYSVLEDSSEAPPKFWESDKRRKNITQTINAHAEAIHVAFQILGK